TLLAALLVIFWWQRGTLAWRRDVLPLLPLFALAAAAGVLTAVCEVKFIGAQGAAFDLSLLDSVLIAGRTIWFYLGKLVWPANLIFVYPRWQIEPSDWRQYLFPLAAAGLLAVAWAMRKRRRGPLAALLFFVGTLFPALGFCHVYPFVYSFVADHFQYLASLGVITLFSAAATTLWRRRSGGQPRTAGGVALSVTLLLVLGVLTWRQSSTYANVQDLYRTTIDHTPECWMAELNLGGCLADQSRFDEAMPHYQRALEIRPNCVEAVNNLGTAAAALGRTDEAIAHYKEAMKIKPDYADAYFNLGNLMDRLGRLDEAIGYYQQAIEHEPQYSKAYNNLGSALLRKGFAEDAIVCYRGALECRPDYAMAWNNLADAYAAAGRLPEALSAARQALEFANAQGNSRLATAARERVAAYSRQTSAQP
ncbi:MAG: tetratricopeptide repeat protein, partial [Thermoguttaceae bacterium]